MASTAYVGLPRSGKSYEVVSNVILPAIESGRDVVTNIAGVSEQSIYDFLTSEGKDPSTFGHIKTFDPQWLIDDLTNKNNPFYLTESRYKENIETFIQPGDLCAFDEVWRFWPTDKKVSNEAMNFFRMHGHFVNQHNGFTVEIALISQDIQDIHRSIKSVVLETYLMEKNTAVGSDNSYMIKVYQRTRVIGKPLQIFGPKVYQSKYFPLYISNSCNSSSVKPREKRVDTRNNVLKSKLVLFGIPAAIIMILVSSIGLYRFFHRPISNPAVATDIQKSDTKNALNQPQQPPTATTQKTELYPSSDWRLSGVFGVKPNLKGLLVNRYGQTKIVMINALQEYGQVIVITAYPKNQTYNNQPFEEIKNGIL